MTLLIKYNGLLIIAKHAWSTHSAYNEWMRSTVQQQGFSALAFICPCPEELLVD